MIGVYEQRWSAPAGPLCVYLHGVADPGNVGTIVRSAQAFGASSVALGPGCADPYSPKAVRASMGAIFAVPARPRRRRGRAARRADRARSPAPAEILRGREEAARGPVTLLVGSERDGLPAEVVAACERSAPDPDRLRVAERGDGGDRRAVRDDTRTI